MGFIVIEAPHDEGTSYFLDSPPYRERVLLFVAAAMSARIPYLRVRGTW